VRAVVQRVTAARVTASPEPGRGAGPEPGREDAWAASIGRGLVVFVGVERGDGPDDVAYIARKIRETRIFGNTAAAAADRDVDRSVQDVNGQVLVVSQFTLAADCRKGRRPAFDAAAPSGIARPLYESVVIDLRQQGIAVETGQFQSMMHVSLTNDGPVTLLLDSRKRF
jgi:D-aminoacyl-tRNA deacylase